MTVQSTQTPRQYTPGTVAQAQDAAVFERSGAGVYLTMEWIATFVQQTLGNGQAISFGSTAPANSVGDQDDVFFNVTTGEVLRKGATTWAVEANFALDADVTAAITAAFNAHNGAADPHPTYLTQAEATALYKPLTTDDSVATGLRFALKTVTTGTPATGEVQFNNATLSSVTQLLISETGRDGSTIPTLLDMLQATTRIVIQVEQSEGLYAWFNITGAPTDSGTYRTVPVAFVTAPTGVTTVANLGVAGAELTLNFYGAGGSNSSGGVGSGLRFQYDTSSALADQNGLFCRNGASFAAATQLSFSTFESQTNDPPTDDVLTRLTTGAIFEVRKSATAWARYRSTGTPVLDANGDVPCYNVPVAFEASGSDAIANADFIYLTAISDSPTSGANGVPGGQAYVFTTGGTTPSGNVRFSGGILYLHESDRSTPTPVNLTTLWQGLTSGSVIQVIDETTPTNFVNYTLGAWGGNPPKNGTVYELPAVASGVGGAIANGANVRISFALKGATGAAGSGSTINVQEVDGTPSGAVTGLIFPNASVSISGGIATVVFASAASDPLENFFTSKWYLGESSGNRQDSVGTNHLTPFNSPGFDSTFVGASFTGNGQTTPVQQSTLEIATNSTLESGVGLNIYICAMVRFTSIAGTQFIVTKYDQDSPLGEWALYLNASRINFDVNDSTNGLTGALVASTFGNLAVNTNYIIQAWYDASARISRIQINNSAPQVSNQFAATFSLRATDDPFRIGSVYSNRRFGVAGSIKKVGYGKVVPSQAQINAVYNGGNGFA